MNLRDGPSLVFGREPRLPIDELLNGRRFLPAPGSTNILRLPGRLPALLLELSRSTAGPDLLPGLLPDLLPDLLPEPLILLAATVASCAPENAGLCLDISPLSRQ